MNRKLTTTQYITRTALFLALAIIFQNLRLMPFLANGTPLSVPVIGSLVNMALFLSVEFTGVFGGFIISLVSPVVALMQNHLPLPILVPMVFVGNFILVIGFYYLKKINVILAVIVASGLKWAFLALASGQLLPLLGIKLPMPLLMAFSTPQLMTALLGGLIAILIIPTLNKALDKQNGV